MLIKRLIIVIASVALTGTFNVMAQSQQPISDEEKAALAIKLLWSADNAERERAKADLVKLNERAIPGLMTLLIDLIDNPTTPRFVTGREEEGKTLWGHPLDSPGITDKISEVIINSRLEYDIIEILGDLRAKEAIPILVEIMECRMKDNWLRQRMLPEMKALVKIGKPAVPALIKSIEEAEERATPTGSRNPSITEAELQVFIRSSIETAQTRAVIVLGEIGVKSALPVLEKLLEQSNDPNKAVADVRYIQEAIKQIKRSNN